MNNDALDVTCINDNANKISGNSEILIVMKNIPSFPFVCRFGETWRTTESQLYKSLAGKKRFERKARVYLELEFIPSSLNPHIMILYLELEFFGTSTTARKNNSVAEFVRETF